MSHGLADTHVPPPGLTRRPEFRSAAEMRSRSNTRQDYSVPPHAAASRSLLSAQPNADSMQTCQQMMARQIALLEEQTAMLRQNMIDTSCSQQSFQSPEKALESLDPTLREVMQRWKTSFGDQDAALPQRDADTGSGHLPSARKRMAGLSET